jgi:autotransporter-associated beta strand protein
VGNITWNGGTSGNWTYDTSTTPWTNNADGSASAFYQGDNVTLSTPGSTITVTNTGVTAASVTNSAASGTVTLTGGTLTNTSLVQSGNGTLLLSNNVVVNGTETVSAGTLTVASGATNSVSSFVLSGGTVSGSGVLTSAAAYDMRSGTANIALSGTNGLNKTTAGTVILGAANAYTGTTAVSAGTLQYGINDAIGSDAVTVSGGTLDIGSYSDTVGAVTLSSGSITGTSGVLTGTSYQLESGSVSAILGGSGALVKTNAGTVTLSGANTYSGATTITNGALNIQNANALGSTAAGTTVASGAALELQGGVTVGAEALTLNGSGISSGGALRNISGNNLYSGTVTLGSASRINSDAGTLTVSNASAISGATFGLTLGGAGNLNIASVIGTTTGTLTKDGTGTATLSATNTYSGATTVSGGSLVYGVSNAIATGNSVTVGGGATSGTLDLGGFTNTLVNVVISNGVITNGTITASGYRVTNTAGAVVTNTISANLAGTGGFTNHVTNGTTLLSASNNFTGLVRVEAGTLQLGNSWALGSNGADHTTVGTQLRGGILDLNGQTNINETLLFADANSYVTNSSTNTATWSGSIYLSNSTANNFNVGSGRDIVVTGAITNATTSRILNKNGDGVLTFSNANTNQGVVNINAGTLRLGNALALGRADATNSLVISNGATLDVNGYTATSARAVSMAGTGVNGNGAIYNSSSSAATFSNGITLTNNTSVGSVGNLSLSGIIGGAGYGVTKVGAGTLTLSGVNTYTGGTTISNGAVSVSSSNNLGTNNTGGIGSVSLAGTSSNTAKLISTVASGASNAPASLALDSVTMSGNAILSLANVYTKLDLNSLTLSGSSNQLGIVNSGWGVDPDGATNTFTLLSSVGSITGGNNMSLLFGTNTVAINGSTTLGRNTYQFIYTNDNTYQLNTWGGAFDLVWSGGENALWNTDSTNWNEAGGATGIAFVDGDNVTFTGLGQTNIIVTPVSGPLDAGPVSAGTMVVSNNTGALTLSGSNVTATLTVGSGGNLIVAGSLTPRGSVSVDAGTLQIGNGGATGVLGNSNAINLTNSGSFIVNLSTNYTLSNQVTGAGSFSKLGSGTTVLATSNTYTGNTIVGTGTLQVGSATAGASTATAGSGSIVISNGATLAFYRSNVYTNANNISGDGSVSQLGTSSLELAGNNTFSGGLYLNTNANGTVWAYGNTNLGSGTIYAVSSNSKIGLSKGGLTPASATMDINNQMSTSFASNSTDVLSFQTGSSNTYTITLNGFITGAGGLKISGSATTNGSGTSGTGAGTLYVTSTNNDYTGGTELGNGRISISAGSALGTGNILFSSTNLGNTILQVTGGTTLSQNFTLGASAANSTALAVVETTNNTATTISGVISNRTSTNIGALVKTGAGTLILSGANTYTGGTVINEGTLASGNNNTLADAGAITNSGGTLNIGSYSDTVGAVTLSNGTISGTTGVLTSSSILGYGGSAISAVLGGSGTLTKTNTGTLTLSGANTYSGATVIMDSGTLALSGSGSIESSSTLYITNGIFDISGVSGSGASLLALQAGTGTTSSEVVLGSKTLTLGSMSSSNLFNGKFSGSGSVIKIGTSTLTLYGNSTYSGGFTLSNGLIRIANSGGGTNGDGTISNSTFGTGTLTIAGGSIRSSGTAASSGSRTIYTAVNLANSFTLGDSADNGVITFTTNASGATTTLLTNLTITTDSSATWDQAISGAYTLTKAGAATMTLNGNGGNIGSLIVSGGLLRSYSSNTIATITVSNGASLGYGSSAAQPWFGTATITLQGGSTLGQAAATGATTSDRILANNLVLGGDVTFGLGTYGNYFSGNIDLGGATRTITLSNSTDVGGVISNGALTIASTSATRALTLTNNAATYTGATTVNGGVLALTNGAGLSSSTALNLAATTTNASFDVSGITAGGTVIGSLAGASNSSVVLGAKNLTNGGDNTTTTFAGVASGTGGSLTKAGNGTLTLIGVNTYDGDTYVNAGTVKLSGSGAIAAASAVVVSNGATFDFNGLSRTVDGISGAGAVTLGSATLTVSNSATNTFSGNLTGSGGLSKTNTGTQILSGSNSYDGATAVNSGVLNIQNASALGSTTGGTTVLAGGTLALQGGITVDGEALTLNGGASTTTLRNISGNNTYNGTININSGTNRIDSDAGLLTLSSFTGTISSTRSLLVGGVGNTTFSGRFTGSSTGTITKDGAGTLTLSATNFDIVGGVIVNAGTLALGTNSALGAATGITVNNATFDLGSYSNAMGAVTVTNGGRITNGTLTGSSYASGAVGKTNTISANLTGSGGLTLTGNTNTTVLSGTNSYSGDTALNNTTSTNMRLRVSSTNALSSNSSLLGSTSAARLPTLELAAAGDYKMQNFKGGNMIFLATNGAATISFTNTSVTNEMTAGDKSFYASNV